MVKHAQNRIDMFIHDHRLTRSSSPLRTYLDTFKERCQTIARLNMGSGPIDFSSFANPFAADVAARLDAGDSPKSLRDEFLIPSKAGLKKSAISQIRETC